MKQVKGNQSSKQAISQRAKKTSYVAKPTLSPLTKFFLLILGVVIVLSIIKVLYYFETKRWSIPTAQNQKIIATSPTQSITATPSINQSQQLLGILKSLQLSISTTAPIVERKSVDWVDSNNRAVPLKGWEFGVGIVANNYSIGKYGSFSDARQITETSLQPLQSTIENFFIRKGFTINKANEKKTPWAANYGYTQGDIKCLVSLYPQADSFGYFFCGTVDEEELAWWKQLAPVITPPHIPNIQFSVSKLVGNYATGDVGGSQWYAVKVNGHWQEVWEDQNAISCKVVQQYNIPKEIYRSEIYGSECINY